MSESTQQHSRNPGLVLFLLWTCGIKDARDGAHLLLGVCPRKSSEAASTSVSCRPSCPRLTPPVDGRFRPRPRRGAAGRGFLQLLEPLLGFCFSPLWMTCSCSESDRRAPRCSGSRRWHGRALRTPLRPPYGHTASAATAEQFPRRGTPRPAQRLPESGHRGHTHHQPHSQHGGPQLGTGTQPPASPCRAGGLNPTSGTPTFTTSV